mmetsp:Transcript_14036/g.41213  ORF Transcript_14036/g.41213 Transcript_14036/m.41213 type:complete len:220 (-) Transcript_14036:271-930(-)
MHMSHARPHYCLCTDDRGMIGHAGYRLPFHVRHNHGRHVSKARGVVHGHVWVDADPRWWSQWPRGGGRHCRGERHCGERPSEGRGQAGESCWQRRVCREWHGGDCPCDHWGYHSMTSHKLCCTGHGPGRCRSWDGGFGSRACNVFSGGLGLLWLCSLHFHCFPLELVGLVLEHLLYSPMSFKCDEPEATGSLRLSVEHHHSVGDPSVFFKVHTEVHITD